MPDIAIAAVNLVRCSGNRNIAFFSVGNRFVPGPDIPLAPWRDNFATVVLLEPRNDDRGIKSAGIRQYDFLHSFLHNCLPSFLLTVALSACVPGTSTVTRIAFSTANRFAAC